ncbi:MAG: hypothetical protein LN412_03480 [Candidatus Thermoplasmatota archaeon]|nr:hypothetical protein [Candidatus Thermoplasmatota archaeon]
MSEMFGIPVSGVRLNREPRRFPEDLVKYVRTEYGASSPQWLVSEARRTLRGATHENGRKMAWWRRKHGSLPTGKPQMASPTIVQSKADPRSACNHRILEYLGNGGIASYRQCVECRATFVAQGDRTWIFRSVGTPL